MMRDYVEIFVIRCFLFTFGIGFVAGCLVVCGVVWLFVG